MEAKEITFSYDEKTSLLTNVSCEIEKGKVTTIIGPNGSGKSTLLGVLSKSYLPQGGQILLDGKALNQYKPKELAKKLAVVHQQNDAPVDMTVEKLTSFGRLAHRHFLTPQHDEDDEAIDWALACTNLTEKREKTITQLSGGERQRVWIAMALAQKTPILFLDEPTTYLDMYFQFEILELVKSLNERYGLTIVMVLHDVNQAIRYSDRLIVMKAGEIVLEGTPEEMLTAEMFKAVYGVDVLIKEDDEMGLFVVPKGI